MFTSPDTGQDRWNFADGDLRAPVIVLARKAWIFIDAWSLAREILFDPANGEVGAGIRQQKVQHETAVHK